MTERDVGRDRCRPDAVESHHCAERALKLVWENPDTRAVRIDSNPEPMYVTVEDGELAFWAFDYTWKCQTQTPIDDVFGPFDTIADTLHALALDGYGIGTVSKGRIDTEPKPKATGLEDFA